MTEKGQKPHRRAAQGLHVLMDLAFHDPASVFELVAEAERRLADAKAGKSGRAVDLAADAELVDAAAALILWGAT